MPRASVPVTVRQATFSISEEFLRRIWKIKKSSGARFILIIDRKALQKTHSLWQFVSAVYDEVYLSDSHAKVILIDAVTASVVTSQNLTRGNRFESAVISDDPATYRSLLDDFNKIIKYRSVPMHEIMPVPQYPGKSPDKADSPAPQETSILENIERFAGVFLPISDIATILELDPAWLRAAISDPTSPEARAYTRGKAKAKARIRAQEMELAQLGSPLGVQNVKENLIDMEAEEE